VNISIFPTLAACALALVLSACGGQPDVDAASSASAGSVVASPIPATGSASPEPTSTVALAAAAAATRVPPRIAANMPEPDCAAEACSSLRIIDGNAEAWRIDAPRRAALAAGF